MGASSGFGLAITINRRRGPAKVIGGCGEKPSMNETSASTPHCRRTSLLRAALLVGVAIVAITEALSALGMVHFTGFAIADGVAVLAAAGFSMWRSDRIV